MPILPHSRLVIAFRCLQGQTHEKHVAVIQIGSDQGMTDCEQGLSVQETIIIIGTAKSTANVSCIHIAMAVCLLVYHIYMATHLTQQLRLAYNN